MRRALLLGLLLAALFPAAADAASVKLLACVPALEGRDRSATFEARVRALAGSDRMQVRFTLQVREDAAPDWRRVGAPGLDQWLTSDPGVSRYSYSKTVQNLSAPAAYRTVLRFRWLDAAGAVLARSRATSRACRQPDLRPDLAATQIEVARPFDGGPARYAVTVHNDGRSAAGAFAVTLRAGDELLEPLNVPGLAAGERRVLAFAGPPCSPGAPLTVTVDSDMAIGERDEDDNVLRAECLP
jgi:hypothetical protein